MTKKPSSKSLNRVAVLAHVLTTVPVVDLEEYLLEKAPERLLCIHHPLTESSSDGSNFRLFRKAKLLKQAQLPRVKLPSIVMYGLDTLVSLYWLLRHGWRWDIIIALDNLNTLAALLLRSLGLVETVVYYTIDYVPQRFTSPLLNEVYHKIDDFCARHADSVWNVSPRIAEAREEFRGIPAHATRQQVVPIGIWLDRHPLLPYKEIDPYHVVYAGGLLPHQGIQNFLQAMPRLLKSQPKLHLSIIGLGSYETELKNLAEKLGIKNSVSFLGYFENHDDVAEFCSHCGLALALYSKDLDIWSRYADPSKMKTYLAAGLPILTTDVTFFARTLEEKQCGVVVTPNPDEIVAAVDEILSSKAKHQSWRQNARSLANEYQWRSIFDAALEKTLSTSLA